MIHVEAPSGQTMLRIIGAVAVLAVSGCAQTPPSADVAQVEASIASLVQAADAASCPQAALEMHEWGTRARDAIAMNNLPLFKSAESGMLAVAQECKLEKDIKARAKPPTTSNVSPEHHPTCVRQSLQTCIAGYPLGVPFPMPRCTRDEHGTVNFPKDGACWVNEFPGEIVAPASEIRRIWWTDEPIGVKTLAYNSDGIFDNVEFETLGIKDQDSTYLVSFARNLGSQQASIAFRCKTLLYAVREMTRRFGKISKSTSNSTG